MNYKKNVYIVHKFLTKEPTFHILVHFWFLNFRPQYIIIVCAKDKSGFNILKHKKDIILVQFYLLKIVNIDKLNDERYKVYVQMIN